MTWESDLYVEIGNETAIEGYRDPASDDPELVRYREAGGQRTTRLTYPEDIGLQEAFSGTVTAMRAHLAEGGKPVWIDSDSAGLKTLLCEHYQIDPKKTKPRTWGGGKAGGATAAVAQTATQMLAHLPAAFVFPLMVLWGFALARLASMELRTNAGRDFQARVMGDTASTGTGSYAAGTYIGLTANTDAPAAGDTTLTGEISSGTLARAQAIYAHTNGTASYTLTKTFTSDQSVVIAKIGVFNASSAGTMVFESLLNATATLVSGDQLQITETVTL